MNNAIHFGTDGWRSKINEDFTTDNVKRVAEAICRYLELSKEPSKGLFIGYDGRSTSAMFAKACAEVLASNNVQSFLPPRPVPTPIAAFSAIKYNLQGAIMITASHNPQIYNGIKFIPSYGGPATNEITSEIEKLIPIDLPVVKNFEEMEKKGLISFLNPIDDYFSKLESLLSLRSLKITCCLDPMHGATAGIADTILRHFGVKVRTIRGTLDPNFGGGVPDPIQSNLGPLRNAVVHDCADVGLAFDGDGDRITAVTDRGDFLMANRILPLTYLHLLEKRRQKGNAARTVATSHLIDSVGKAFGENVIETPVGFKYIGALLRENKIIIGGEESGGISFSSHIPEKDGIASALMMLEHIAMANENISEIMDNIHQKYGTYESLREDMHFDYMPSAVLNEIEVELINWLGKDIININKIDGLKVYFKDGSWLLFRKSGTENMLRVYAESAEMEKTKSIIQSGISVVNKILSR